MKTEPSVSPAAGLAGAIPFGFQLYTVRREFARNVPGTLQALAQIGYQAVEFWGYAGTPKIYQNYSATELRKLLDGLGLRCCGMHLELAALAGDKLQRTLENNRLLGNSYLNVAAARSLMGSEQGIARLAELLDQAATACRPHHMSVGYHAHPFDFARIKGQSAWQLLFRRTLPEVNMQMDVGNCLAGKADPIALLKEFPGRTPTIHLKEHQEHTFDSALYQEVFQLCQRSCGTQWYIVEMGGFLGKGFDVPRTALARLRRLGK